VAWLDHLGYDEAWFGEHHSAGTEISASPEIMIAVAAERTRHIKLGTGVVSLSYHNPLWVAERIVLLDHLTRGRVMFGAGPGSLDGMASGSSRSARRQRPASMPWHCIGMCWARKRGCTARRSTARIGGSSAQCTVRKPRSRRSPTYSTASSIGSVTFRRLRP